MKRSLVFYLAAITLSGCGISAPNSLPVFYTPAVIANDISYMPKPMGNDSVKTQNYLSASFAGGSLPNTVGTTTMGFLNFSRAITLENINIAYGAYGFFGGTSDGGFEDSRRQVNKTFLDQSIYGLGLRSSIGFFETSGNTEFRILNWENSLSFEGGGYSSFRKAMRNDTEPLSIGADQNTYFTTGGSTEIIWRGSRNTNRNYGFRLFIGSTLGLKSNMNYTENRLSGVATDFSFFIKIKRAYGVLSNGSNLQQVGSKITLGYAF